jgi:hypothetical protein
MDSFDNLVADLEGEMPCADCEETVHQLWTHRMSTLVKSDGFTLTIDSTPADYQWMLHVMMLADVDARIAYMRDWLFCCIGYAMAQSLKQAGLEDDPIIDLAIEMAESMQNGSPPPEPDDDQG